VWKFHPGQINLPPIVLVIICCFLLLRGAKESAGVNAVMVMVKLAILVFFSVIAFSGFQAEHFTPFFNTDNSKGMAGMAGVTAAAGRCFLVYRSGYCGDCRR
jgi:APA family basic amino acid/polyamine antiporter